VTVNDVRWPTGLNATTRVNPDLVGEFRMILAPVDAEVGRGNAQLQISTKSGTNEYHGALVWSVQNTSLDPNTWSQNSVNAAAPWRNLHEYTISAGGPIIKNKTFFFALFNGQIAKTRQDINLLGLTPCAQRGVFRFYDDWNNGNALQEITTGSTPQYASVDRDGNPVAPPYATPGDPDSGPHNGILRYASVWGPITNLDTLAPDCSNLEIGGVPFSDSANWANPDPWDPNRPVRDPSGFITYFMNRLPGINNYERGDGLNTAGYKWPRTLKGSDNRFGVGEDVYRKQINVRMDHILTDAHRLSGSWSWERTDAANNYNQTEDGWGGHNWKVPMVLTATLTSTLRPTLLNEFRFGMSRTGSNGTAAYNNPEDNTGEEVRALYRELGMVTADGQETVIGPGMGAFSWAADTENGNFYGGRGNVAASIKDISPRWSFGDTVSWTRGAHSIRFGGEWRRQSSQVWEKWNGNFTLGHNPWPYVHGGEGDVSTPSTFDHVIGNLAGSAGNTGNQRALRDLLVFQTGSMTEIHQWRYINDINDTKFNDPVAEPAMNRDTIQKEFSFFFKDDWKVTSNLTLNLGVRYDYFGVPYLKNGMTTGLFTVQKEGGDAIFGPTVGFNNWFVPNADSDPDALVALQSIGPGSPNSGMKLYPADKNNFGPAVGFAYQLPWFGKGRTTIRGGYQMSYIGMNGNFSTIESAAGRAPGLTYLNTWTGIPESSNYFGLADIANFNGIPLPEGVEPGFSTFTLYDRLQNIASFAPNYRHPYVQNLTFAITHNVTSNLTVDLRYIGTLTRKNFSSLNLNFPNFTTNGLLQAFDAARSGENPALLDNLMQGLMLPRTSQNVNTPGHANYDPDLPTYYGAQAIRDSSFWNSKIPVFAPGWLQPFNRMLANGDYDGLANALNLMALPGGQTGEFLELNGFPVNFIKASPQFNNATMYSNQGHANYHSFQGQITLRPTVGVNFQSTYTWSKNLGLSGITDPTNISADYTLLASDRRHNWVTYGGWEMPFGPGRIVGGDTSGVLARLIEGWQMSWITSVTSGQPLNISAADMLYGNGVPDEVNEGFDFNSVGIYWPQGALSGNYFGDRYAPVVDPVCSNDSIIDPSIQSSCTLNAIQDTLSGNVVLQNPLPGTRGNFGRNRISNIVRWNVDMAISKSVQIAEGKSFRIRLDASNIFNHPFPSGGGRTASGARIVFPTPPAVDITGNTFGDFTQKVGGRTFQFMARFDF
jgi:hypothetical protein